LKEGDCQGEEDSSIQVLDFSLQDSKTKDPNSKRHKQKNQQEIRRFQWREVQEDKTLDLKFVFSLSLKKKIDEKIQSLL